jgi:hypothetical protein
VREADRSNELNLKEKTLNLWQNLEEVEFLYLKDFPKITPLVFSFGQTKVSINFFCYEEECRDYGIGAISIAKQETDYGEFRKDIVIRKKGANFVESIVKEYDLDSATNHLPGDKHYPFVMPDLSQPIDYYEEVLEDSKTPNAMYRELEEEDIYEALKYLDPITNLLNYIAYQEHLTKPK